MLRQRLAVAAWMVGAVVVVFGSSLAQAGGPGLGGGAGHALAGPGFYGRGYGHYGYGRGYGFYGYPGYCGFGLGLGLGYGLGYGYPYAYGYGYPYPYGYPVYVDVASAPSPAAVIPQGGLASGQAPAPAVPGSPMGLSPVRLTDSDVLLSIHVPPDALVRINGTPTTENGPRREFVSSGLAPGRSYTFLLTAKWTGPDGQVVELERRLSVQGGERRNVDFTAPSLPAE
jgi:uncharacterized protein (TIGR03000 family)